MGGQKIFFFIFFCVCKIWGVSETTQNAWINCTETENKLHLPLQRNNLCHFLGNEDYKNLKKEWHPQPVLLEENLNPELSCWAAQILGFGLKPANKSCWKCCGWGKTGPRSMPNPGSFSMFQNRNKLFLKLWLLIEESLYYAVYTKWEVQSQWVYIELEFSSLL